MFIYDKVNNEVRGPEAIENVAQERFFYDLPIEHLPAGVDPQFQEKALAEMEANFNMAIEAALRVVDGKGANLHERLLMSFFVAIQHLRTRAFRNEVVEFMTSAQEEVMNTFLRLVRPDLAEQVRTTVQYDKAAAVALHAQQMWGGDLLEKITNDIYNKLWIIGVNLTGIPLFTSDNPVVLRCHAQDENEDAPLNVNDLPGLTLATIEVQANVPRIFSKGVEIIFPITPQCALIMLDREFFSYLEPHQGQVYSLTKEHIQDFNMLQSQQSERQIFSVSNDFELAKLTCQSTPQDAKQCMFTVKLYPQYEI